MAEYTGGSCPEHGADIHVCCDDWVQNRAEDDTLNNLLATGAVFACLHAAQRQTGLTKVTVVTEQGQATNQLLVWFEDLLKSPYRLTVERVDEP